MVRSTKEKKLLTRNVLFMNKELMITSRPFSLVPI